MDDSAARLEWAWQPEYDLPRMTAEMIEHVTARLAAAPAAAAHEAAG